MTKRTVQNLKKKRFCERSFLLKMLLTGVALVSFVTAGYISSAIGGDAERIRSPLRVDDLESLEFGTSLILDPGAFSALCSRQNIRFVDFPLSRTEKVDLELERFHITTPATRIVAGTENGDIPIAVPEITLFRGTVVGQPKSRVVLTISPRGMQGIIEMVGDSYAFSPRRSLSNAADRLNHVIHRKSDLPSLLPPGRPELSVFDAIKITGPQEEGPVPPALPGSFQVCRLALECDFEFWSQFNDYGLALDYIYTLFAAIGDIFERDVSSKIALTYIRIWTTVNDPYSYVGGADTGLNEFRDYWVQNHNPGKPQFIERDVAHLLSSRGVGAYGWEGVLCDYDLGFSISGGIALEPTLAQKLFHDIRYAGHEIGHNFNGRHTHCLIDPTTNDWVDKCVTEPNCNQTVDCSTAPSSIMSYCKNCPGGLANQLEEFDTVNITRIRSHVNASCLRLARNPSYVDWRNTLGSEDGTLASPYNTIKEGTEAVLPYGTVSVASGNYAEAITIWQPMTINASGGTVIIGE